VTDSVVISDPYRVQLVADKRQVGGVMLRRGNTRLMLTSGELSRLLAYSRNDARILRFPVKAAETAPESTPA
jgi:hypothetical protein